MFVKTVRNDYLKDPAFLGDGWFIECTEDEGVVLVIKSRAIHLTSIEKRARRILKENNVQAKIKGMSYATTSAFPPRFSGLYTAWKLELVLNGPMPDIECFPEIRVSSAPYGATVHGD